MRSILVAAALVGAALVLISMATRVPAVQDALFDRAVNARFASPPTELFDGDGLKVFFCGTGSPLPSTARAQTCTAVFVADRFFLVDAGTGSYETVAAAGIPGERLAGIFLTHYHSDHIGDLSEANVNSWVTGRDAPLDVFGPSGADGSLGAVIDGVNAAFATDDGYRTAHHGKGVAPPRTAGMNARPFDLGDQDARVVYDRDGLTVTSFTVEHEPVDPAVGYRFDYKGRSVVVSGDTAYSENLIEVARGADLLIHEAQANHMVAKMGEAVAAAGNARVAKILADIPDYHTSPEEAARAANQAGVEHLILNHLTPAPDNAVARRIFMRGVSKIRKKNVRIAEDRDLVALPEGGGFDFSRL